VPAMKLTRSLLGAAVLAMLAAACTAATASDPPDLAVPATAAPSETAVRPERTTLIAAAPLDAPDGSVTTTAVAPETTTTTVSPFVRPAWLGRRLLPLRADGFGEVQPTPPELIDRRLATPSLLPPPASGGFESSVGPVPPDVLARSSWTEECPVAVADLAYVTVAHLGFDGGVHTGEMIVNARAAASMADVFAELFAVGFPIEEMRVLSLGEIDAPPTGDGNLTSSFECRPATGSNKWSQHAYGLAVDINPFHNPYLKRDLVLPELASFYLDRDLALPGMVDKTVVVEAFAAIGWKWGGNWSSLKDWMHFSESGT